MEHPIIIKNEETFKALYKEFYRPLFFYAQKFIDDEAACDDIVQDIFIRLWNQYRNETIYSIQSFLYRSVKNECLSYIKKEAVRTKHAERTIKESVEADFIYTLQLYEEEVFRKINNLIETMPEQQKKIFKLVVNGYNNPSIAELLNLSINTVKTHKLRARQYLRKQLKHILQLLVGYAHI